MENKVTIEKIESKIKGESYLVLPDGRTTLCILEMENGYTIKGLSACVDASNFDLQTGRKFAREDAIKQIWPLEGYLLAQRMFEERVQVITIPTVKEINEWNAKHAGRRIIAKHAPHGLKKDGTPKKKPGTKASS